MKSEIHAGPWCGAVTPSEATIKVVVTLRSGRIGLLLSNNPRFTGARIYQPQLVWNDVSGQYPHHIATFRISGLLANRRYYYRLILDSESRLPTGTFRTFPEPGSRTSFKFAFASCSGKATFWNRYYPQPESFIAVAREENLLFFQHLGDLHYKNIREPEIIPRLQAYDFMLHRPEVREMFRSVPVNYIWDDHDFLGVDSAGFSQYRDAANTAVQSFDLYAPHYPLADPQNGIYHSYTVGRVLFVVTDNRFNQVNKAGPDHPKTVLGEKQKKWWKSQMLRASDHDLVVWVSSFPWTGNMKWAEYWAGYPDERRELSQFLADHSIRNVCMLAGHAHMLAMDDGTHSSFAENGNAGFPVFQAAALESRPGRKGGIFTKGRIDGGPGRGIAGSGQYGTMEIVYEGDGEQLQVWWEGKRVIRRFGKIVSKPMLQYDFSLKCSPGAILAADAL